MAGVGVVVCVSFVATAAAGFGGGTLLSISAVGGGLAMIVGGAGILDAFCIHCISFC